MLYFIENGFFQLKKLCVEILFGVKNENKVNKQVAKVIDGRSIIKVHSQSVIKDQLTHSGMLGKDSSK